MSANKAFFIFFGTSIIALTGLIILLTKSLPLTIAHAIYICQKNLSNAAFILPHSIPFTLTLLAIAILATGLLILTVQIIKTRIYIRKNIGKRTTVPKVIKLVAEELNLKGKIDIVKDNNRFSFCYGMIRTRICLSTSLIKNLEFNELKAVLLHESYHLKNYDPLKIVFGKVLSYMFFFIPTLQEVDKYYAFSKEIAADDLAIKKTNKESLLSALSKMISIESPRFSGVAALGNIDNLEKRINYLTGKQTKVLFRPSTLNLLLSIIVVSASFVILNAPVNAMGMDDSADNSYFLCPYGNQCANECKKGLKSKKVNFSENKQSFSTNKLYTPVEREP